MDQMEKSDYESTRNIFSASKFLDKLSSKHGLAGTHFGMAIKIAANVVKAGIFIEDWRHTDKEIEHKIGLVLSSPEFANASEYPDLYQKFEQYVRKSLKEWVPDRDYPKIGYLPKELLYDQSLGEKKITKYWPEATKKDQAKYIALTFEDLVLNYELFWIDLCQNNKLN